MIDSTNVEERIKGLVGISCQLCLDSGFEQEYIDGEGWVMILIEDPIRDEHSRPVRRLKVCHHGKIGDLGY